jgi:hypothetical protein
MHMTKHVAGVWSITPASTGRVMPQEGEQRWTAPAVTDDIAVTDRARGPGTALAATVVGGGSGPDHVVAICELADGSRCYARSTHPDAVDAVERGAWDLDVAHLRPMPDGTTEICW